MRSRLITHVETSQPVVALTFDDGPHPVYTPQVLQVLEKHGAKATFFMVGEAAALYPKIVHDVAAKGHVIGNHSWNHPYMPHIASRWRRLQQLWSCARAIAPFGQRLFRPPFGAQNKEILFDALLFRYRVVLWNVSAQDWVPQTAKEIASKMIERLKPGDIFLLHDAIRGAELTAAETNREAMLAGLEQALTVLKARLQFVTVPELLLSGKPVDAWPLNTSVPI